MNFERHQYHGKALHPGTLAAWAAVLAALLPLWAGSAFAADPHYKGKEIEVVVPFAPGGAAEVGARFLQPFLEKHIPGNPRVIVNPRPGGASILGANWFAQNAKPDGTTILHTTSSTAHPYMLEYPQVKYDLTKMRVGYSLSFGPVMYISPKTGVKTAADLKNAKGLIYGGIGAAASDLPTLLSFEVLKLDVKAVLGFTGRGPIRLGEQGPNLIVLYSIIPWIGVMAAGYAFGAALTLEPQRRNRICLRVGLGATALFLVLRGLNLYGDPVPWSAGGQRPDGAPGMPAVLFFLNTTKYPASLNFLLMTLGPTIALIPLLERARGALARWVTVYGRVPFFYYVLHIPLIHALALVVSKIRLGAVSPWLFANHPMGSPGPPEGYVWSLGLLYAMWAVTIVLLYFPCRWFAGLKARRNEWWLRYL